MEYSYKTKKKEEKKQGHLGRHNMLVVEYENQAHGLVFLQATFQCTLALKL